MNGDEVYPAPVEGHWAAKLGVMQPSLVMAMPPQALQETPVRMHRE